MGFINMIEKRIHAVCCIFIYDRFYQLQLSE